MMSATLTTVMRQNVSATLTTVMRQNGWRLGTLHLPVFSLKMNLWVLGLLTAAVRQVFCVFLFLTGVSLFGTIIAQTNSIILQLSREGLELANRLERYTSFMRHYRYANGTRRGRPCCCAEHPWTHLSYYDGSVYCLGAECRNGRTKLIFNFHPQDY